MMIGFQKNHAIENLLRPTVEYYSAAGFMLGAILLLMLKNYMLFSTSARHDISLLLLLLSAWRLWQGSCTTYYKRRLLHSSVFALSTAEVPLDKAYLYLGHGFTWTARHTQRLHMLKEQRFERFTQHSWLYQKIRLWEKTYPSHWLSQLTQQNTRWNLLKPLPPVGGKPWIHSLGEQEKPIFIPQKLRTGHMLVFGTTGVGKTRFASILINQDIRNGEAVLVLDPKGDLGLMQDMYSACRAAGRLDDFLAMHVGFADISAHYNPLSSFDSVSEVATRVVGGISASSDGAVFKDFAWKFVNIVASCLVQMGQSISFRSIAFYITRLDLLLSNYAKEVHIRYDKNFEAGICLIMQQQKGKLNKHKKPFSETDAIKQYLQSYVKKKVEAGDIDAMPDQIIIELLDASLLEKAYYDKITASVGPVFAKINQSNAASLFSFKNTVHNEIKLMDVIKKRKVVYIGLDSMNNAAVAKAVGKAVIADLVSLAGKIYKENTQDTTLCLHSDEFSEIVEDQFIILLNKGRGAGMKITAYSQTINDIEAAFSGNMAKAKMAEGNFNTLMMLRVENADTANALASKLPQIDVFTRSQGSSVNDSADGKDGNYFTSSNADSIHTKSAAMLNVNDLVSLPTGQAFVFTNGGELYKIRAPLTKFDDGSPKDITALLKEVNGYE